MAGAGTLRSSAKRGEDGMHRESSQSGSTKIIVAAVVVLVAAGIVVYNTSDVWRTRMDKAADQYAHWTPENIAKAPEDYLHFCETEATKALTSLKASEIAVAQNRASLQNTLTEAGNAIRVGEKALTELKTLFTAAETASQWPITWQGRSWDQATAKRQIVSLHKQVQSQTSLKGKVEAGINKLDAQMSKILEARAETQNQITEIKTSREVLKVQKLTEDLTTRLASIKGVLQATIDTASETSGPLTLEQLAEQSVGTVDDAEFNAILGK
jgi:hypothetical protein